MKNLISIGGVNYKFDNCNEEEKNMVSLYNACDLRIRNLEYELALCKEVKSMFFSDLNQEILLKKAGVIFD